MKPVIRKLNIFWTVIFYFYRSSRFKLTNEKFLKLSGKDSTQDSIEEAIDELLGQKERDSSAINTRLANLSAEIQSVTKSKDDLAQDKQAKLREIECMYTIPYTPWSRSPSNSVSLYLPSHQHENKGRIDRRS